MKIDLNKIEETFDINLDDYMKFIVTNIYWESIDECDPVTYKIKDNSLYIPNNFFFIAFNARPAYVVKKPTKTIIAGKNTKGNVFIIQTELNIGKYFNYSYKLYEIIQKQIKIANAEYSETITPYKLNHIINQLPIGLIADQVDNKYKDETEDDFDTEVF